MYDVICVGRECGHYEKCKKKCLKKIKHRKKIMGCNYSKTGDCEKCNHKDNCYLLKPSSQEIREVEIGINDLKIQIRNINHDINLSNIFGNSIYLPFSVNQMLDRKKDLMDLLRVYDEYFNELLSTEGKHGE